MIDQVNIYLKEVEGFQAESLEVVEAFRIRFLGKKGILNDLFSAFKDVPNEDKKAAGLAINTLKINAQDKVQLLKDKLSSNQNNKVPKDDLTKPGASFAVGSQHPISLVKNQIVEIFSRIGFNISEGPEIEDDWHNFSALNLPEHHPARDMQDTFFYTDKSGCLIKNTYQFRSGSIYGKQSAAY